MKTKTGAVYLRYGAMGLIMGFVLGHIGFGNYGQVHRLFLLQDLRLLLTFAGAVGVAAVAFLVIREPGAVPHKIFHPGIVPGSLLFGAGWALTGACPSIALVQLGQGQLPAVFTLFGIAFGSWAYRIVHRRYLRWDTGSCE